LKALRKDRYYSIECLQQKHMVFPPFGNKKTPKIHNEFLMSLYGIGFASNLSSSISDRN